MKKFKRFIENLIGDFLHLICCIIVIAVAIVAFWAGISAIGWTGIHTSTFISSLQPTDGGVVGKPFMVGVLITIVGCVMMYIIMIIHSIIKYFRNVWKRSSEETEL